MENTDFDNRHTGTRAPEFVTVLKEVRVGENVRPRGMDLHSGDVVLRAGWQLKPQDLGLLAMLGITSVLVYRKPRVALLSSGDELIDPDAPLEEGKIRDSNSYTLAALIIFAANGQVDWSIGLVLCIGNGAGAWIASRMAVTKGDKLIKVVLGVMMAVMAAGYLGLIPGF